MKRTSNIEVEKRILAIQGWIIDGDKDYLILKKSTAEWGISSRQAKRYLKKAYELWSRESSITIEERRNGRIAELKQDLRTLNEKYRGTPAGLSVILAIKKELSKLEGLYPAKTVKVSEDTDAPLISLIRQTAKKNERHIKLIVEDDECGN